MKQQFKVIGFDLDGTLVNSLPDLTWAVNAAFAEFQLPTVTEEQMAVWIGNGAEIMLKRALDWAGVAFDQAQFETLKTHFNHYYAKNVCRLSCLYPHVKTTLEALKAQGFILALVTNKPTCHVPNVLKALGIDSLFSEALGGQSLPAIKPHPAPLFYLCGKFGILPSELLFVGDSKNDVLAAHNAGCKVIGLTYGFNYNEPIANASPDWVVSDFAEILNIVNKE